MPLVGMLHGIAALSFVLGLVSLVIWAWKTWKPHTYKKAGLWMVAIAIISCILCCTAMAFGIGFDGKGNPMMKKGKTGSTLKGAAYEKMDCM